MYLLSNKNLTNRKKRCISIEKQIPSSNSEVFEQSALSISKNKKIKNDEWCSSPGKKYSHLQDQYTNKRGAFLCLGYISIFQTVIPFRSTS